MRPRMNKRRNWINVTDSSIGGLERSCLDVRGDDSAMDCANDASSAWESVQKLFQVVYRVSRVLGVVTDTSGVLSSLRTMYDTIRNQLERDGYVVLDDFLTDAECDEIREAGVQLARGVPDEERRAVFKTGSDDDQKQTRDDYFLNSNDKIRYFFEEGALGPDGKLKVDPEVALNKIGHALHLLHPIFRCYTYSDRVKAVCRELALLEPAVVQSMYIYKNPGLGGEVVPHQDITYLHTEPIPPVGFWIALEDATIQNGCLWMAPGSHKSGVHRRLSRNPDKTAVQKLIHDRPLPIYPQSSFTAVPVSKGTCILIHGNVVHKSAHNHSQASRHAYTFHVVERKDNHYAEDNWLQEGPAAPFLNIYSTPQIV